MHSTSNSICKHFFAVMCRDFLYASGNQCTSNIYSELLDSLAASEFTGESETHFLFPNLKKRWI
jgi:hypothetical protein